MNEAALDWSSPRSILLALLVLGHVLSSWFIPSSDEKGNESPMPWPIRGLLVGVMQVAIVATCSLASLPLVLFFAFGPAIEAIETFAARAGKRYQRRFEAYLATRVVRITGIAVLVYAWPPLDPSTSEAFASLVSRTAVLASLVIVNLWWGSHCVSRLLIESRPAGEQEQTGLPGRGRFIGMLERLLVMVLVLADQWGAVGLVLTAKSVARFERLKNDQAFAEAYLIGTMSSVLIAIGCGVLLRWLILGPSI